MDGLSESEMVVLELIISGSDVSTPDVVDALGISRRGAQKLLARLVDRGIVERTGAARGTRYRLASRDDR